MLTNSAVDSRLIAQALGIEHTNLLGTIRKFRDRLEKRGHVVFQTEKAVIGVSEIFCWLNKRHCVFLINLLFNTVPNSTESLEKILRLFP